MSKNLASYIDHTCLKPYVDEAEIEKLCREAKQYHFAAVCVAPFYVPFAKKQLQGSDVKVATVIGFPLGYDTLGAKKAAVTTAIAAGADELDLVHNLSALKNQDWQYLAAEVTALLQPIRLAELKLKVIIESGILSNEEIVKCCELYAKYHVDFIKTSTGFAEKGASVEAVQLIRKNLPSHIEIKASGGVKTKAFAEELIAAGATRIGTSSGVELVN